MADDIEQNYTRAGHPPIDELKRAQGTIPTSDPGDLYGQVWPEDE